MKAIAAFVLILFTGSIMAAEGTTFCPQPSSYKFNNSSGYLEAPAGWRVYSGNGNTKVIKFKRLEAYDDGKIFGCYYDMKVGNTPIEVVTTANYYYVADNVHDVNWRRGSIGRICENESVMACAFHLES